MRLSFRLVRPWRQGQTLWPHSEPGRRRPVQHCVVAARQSAEKPAQAGRYPGRRCHDTEDCRVLVTDVDDRGRVKMSIRAAAREAKQQEEAPEPDEA